MLFCGRTVLGFKCKDGVVLGIEKILHSKLMKRKVNRRIMTIDLHAGFVRKMEEKQQGFLYSFFLRFRWLLD